MSRLVSRRPTRRAPRSVVSRHHPQGDEHFFGKVDNRLERGHVVMVSRGRCGFLTIVKNGMRYLVRDGIDYPIGTFSTLSAAVAALDGYIVECDEDSGDDAGSAA